MIDKNSFKEYCRARGLAYSDELWQKWCRLTQKAVKRASDENKKRLVEMHTHD